MQNGEAKYCITKTNKEKCKILLDKIEFYSGWKESSDLSFFVPENRKRAKPPYIQFTGILQHFDRKYDLEILE